MYNKNNQTIVDEIISEFSKNFEAKFREIMKIHGFNWNGTIDFSELSSKIINSLNNGKADKIKLIIDSGVAEKLLKFDENTDRVFKKHYSEIHKSIMRAMVDYAKQTDGIYADKIRGSVEPSFRESLQKVGDNYQKSLISNGEAAEKNAQAMYDKTGKIPEGYSLNESGKVSRNPTEGNKSSENNEIKEDIEPKIE